MENKKILNGFYNYTVLLTYAGFLLGLFGIVCAISGDYRMCMIMLMCAGICDMFDGAVAATKKRTAPEKNFGIQIDSLSDLVCFGILPAVFAYQLSGQGIVALIACGLYALCALIRLAYFNVCEEERQKSETGARKYYTGLPVTSAAVLWPLIFLLVSCLGELPKQGVLPGVAFAMAVAFVLGFNLKKPHLVGKLVLVVIGVGELIATILCVGNM
jgi:CDP-diacylglycerol--serine O-phosphatidyltransferase